MGNETMTQPTDAEVEAVARSFEPQAWWHPSKAEDTDKFASLRDVSLRHARTAIIALDEVRNKQ